MKVNVEIDCTPLEARQFLGLPNLEPMQTAVMARMETKMLSEMDRFSPESIMKSWLTMMPQNAESMQEIFKNMFNTAMTRTDRQPEQKR
jgi:hypothetical protein